MRWPWMRKSHRHVIDPRTVPFAELEHGVLYAVCDRCGADFKLVPAELGSRGAVTLLLWCRTCDQGMTPVPWIEESLS
jgi:hypothetical protein